MKHLFIIYLGILFENENGMANDKKIFNIFISTRVTSWWIRKCIELKWAEILAATFVDPEPLGQSWADGNSLNVWQKIMEW